MKWIGTPFNTTIHWGLHFMHHQIVFWPSSLSSTMRTSVFPFFKWKTEISDWALGFMSLMSTERPCIYMYIIVHSIGTHEVMLISLIVRVSLSFWHQPRSAQHYINSSASATLIFLLLISFLESCWIKKVTGDWDWLGEIHIF